MTSSGSEEQQDTATNSSKDPFDRATEDAGGGSSEDGLYRACMRSIRGAHLRANRLRASLVLAGLFTDRRVYRDVLTAFYVATAETESKLDELAAAGDETCRKILSLGYRFAPQYERDLEVLWGNAGTGGGGGGDDDRAKKGGPSWKDRVIPNFVADEVPAAGEYRSHIRRMKSGNEAAGAAFVLWGALIIGGGAAAYPRARSLVGDGAVSVFEDVVGPGREARKREFVRVWESLATPEDTASFEEIVASCQKCMQHNNDIFTSLQRNPWWVPYAISSAVGLVSILAGWLLYGSYSSTGGGREGAGGNASTAL